MRRSFEIQQMHISKFVDTVGAASMLSQKLLISNTFKAPTETFGRGKTDSDMKQKYSTIFMTKDTMDTIEPNNDFDASPGRHSDSKNDKSPCEN